MEPILSDREQRVIGRLALIYFELMCMIVAFERILFSARLHLLLDRYRLVR